MFSKFKFKLPKPGTYVYATHIRDTQGRQMTAHVGRVCENRLVKTPSASYKCLFSDNNGEVSVYEPGRRRVFLTKKAAQRAAEKFNQT